MIYLYYFRKHKKHRCKHRHKGSESESGESETEDVELIDELLESGLEVIVSNHDQPRDRERDVEIMQASAGNGIVESMKIVVDNRNGTRDQVSNFFIYKTKFDRELY